MRFLASKNLANILLIIFSVYLSVAMLWSEQKLLESPIILILGILFFVNLLACTLTHIIKKPYKYRIGLILLHIGLLLFTAGYGIYHFGSGVGYRFLGLGQTIKLSASDLKNWQSGYFSKDWDSNILITMKNIDIVKDKKGVRLKSGTIAYGQQNSPLSESKIGFDHPIKINKAKIHVEERGFSPIVLWNGTRTYWSLSTERRKDREVYKDVLANGNTTIEGEYFPAGPDGRNGILKISYGGKLQTLKPGDSISVNGSNFTWVDTGYWMQIRVNLEPGINIIWLASVIIILGSAIYYIPLLWKRENHVI